MRFMTLAALTLLDWKRQDYKVDDKSAHAYLSMFFLIRGTISPGTLY